MLENKKADAENICFLRFLADSNRRTRFCRPLTKPLIQGTVVLSFPFDTAKVVLFYYMQNFLPLFFSLTLIFFEKSENRYVFPLF